MNEFMRTVHFEDKDFQIISDLRKSVFGKELGENRKDFLNDEDKNAFHILYALKDVPIGCGSVCIKNGRAEIYDLCVLERFRDFKVGTKIFKDLLAFAKKQYVKEIYCHTPAKSLKFLHKMGMPHNGVTYQKNGISYIECLNNLVFEGARWVSFGTEAQAVIATADFYWDGNADTELYVTGLGFCHIYINGEPVSDRLLAPAWTNYSEMNTSELIYPIFDKMTYRILYERLPVSRLLKKGKNNITFHIGGGWYCQSECPNEGVLPYGNLLLCYKILSGGNIIAKSDEALKYTKSFVQRASLYYGEDQTAVSELCNFKNYDYPVSTWLNAQSTTPPLAVLNEQSCPPDRVIETIKPKCLVKTDEYALYDVGENVAGYAVIKFPHGKSYRGDTCIVRYAEELNPDNTLNFLSAGGLNHLQKDTFIYEWNCGEFYPRFTWHGGRYFEVLGKGYCEEYKVVHTDIKPKIKFKSSDETLQWIVDSYMRTQMNNIHCCVPSDCPHRERLGYTGDGQLASRAVMTIFDCEGLYRKWMQDIADSQNIYNGHVQHTAPFYGGGGGPGGWGGAMVIVPCNFYKFFGDKKILKKYLPNMRLYLDYMESRTENSLVVMEEYTGWCLGDWCSPDNKNLIPIPFVNTYFYLKTLKMTMEACEILGEDKGDLPKRFEKTKAAFLNEYFCEETGTFCNSIESADAYGFDLGLGNEKTLPAIVEKYTALGEFDTGIFGTDILIRVLCENGYKDLAKTLLTSQKANTFYNMKKQGATTLWETWNGDASHSHPMFGAVCEYIVKYFNEDR